MRVFLRDTVTTILIAVIIVFGLQAVVQKFVVLGTSMNFTLRDGQHVLANKVVYKFHEPERGDVIIFHPPDNQKDDYVKRIIGLPGESIEIKDREVYINGSKLSEPYIKDPPEYTLKRQIPENEYFVLGDNRNNSSDSHNGWTLPRQNIVGKAWLSIWPPDKWGLVGLHYLLIDDTIADNMRIASDFFTV
ncbi:MAG: signal peptidase I [Dehalococcoidales bacterium]|nr:signal peptidase I [Dehalococcoidales bacterium]